jgi:hypothetical protein
MTNGNPHTGDTVSKSVPDALAALERYLLGLRQLQKDPTLNQARLRREIARVEKQTGKRLQADEATFVSPSIV